MGIFLQPCCGSFIDPLGNCCPGTRHVVVAGHVVAGRQVRAGKVAQSSVVQQRTRPALEGPRAEHPQRSHGVWRELRGAVVEAARESRLVVREGAGRGLKATWPRIGVPMRV